MQFEEWKELNQRALDVISDFSAAGVTLPAGRPGVITSTFSKVAMLRARALDSAEGSQYRAGDALLEELNSIFAQQASARRRVRARDDQQPQSDLEYFTARAAEHLRLA